MITKPTVLILGAGASIPYGYPSGSVLRSSIVNTTRDSDSFRLYESLGINQTIVNDFINALHRSPLPSVDGFLEHRQEFVTIGKIAITKELVRFEDELSLFAKSDWYQALFEEMNTTFENFLKNRLSIITFNYDRSFEQFLFASLFNLYGKSREECAAIVSKIPIVHVHGKIGDLPWESGSYTREYKPINDANLIKASSDKIRIVHEQNAKDDKLFAKAHRLLTHAKRIYLLGFGYHEINLQRLDLSSLKTEGKEIKGCHHNLGQGKRDEVFKITKGRVDIRSTSAHDVLGFLQNECHFR